MASCILCVVQARTAPASAKAITPALTAQFVRPVVGFCVCDRLCVGVDCSVSQPLKQSHEGDTVVWTASSEVDSGAWVRSGFVSRVCYSIASLNVVCCCGCVVLQVYYYVDVTASQQPQGLVINLQVCFVCLFFFFLLPLNRLDVLVLFVSFAQRTSQIGDPDLFVAFDRFPDFADYEYVCFLSVFLFGLFVPCF